MKRDHTEAPAGAQVWWQVWYATRHIEPVEVERVTAAQVVAATGLRIAREADRWCLRPSREEAVAALLDELRRNVQMAEAQARLARERLADAQSRYGTEEVTR